MVISVSANNLEAWKKELEGLRADVAAAKAALRAGEIPEARERQEPQLGPLPAELRLEAEKIRVELDNINVLIRAEMDKNQSERDRLHTAPRQPREANPVYLDTQG